MAERGRFITFEGGEGVGKSTQIKRLSEFLVSQDVPHLMTREPGGSHGAEEIRNLVVQGEPGRWSVTSETLLLFAARHDLLENLIRPALSEGTWVLCDRFVDSTYAYQGTSRGMPRDDLDRLSQMVVADTQPDLTFVMDMDPTVALERTEQRKGNENRFEQFPIAWHEGLRQAFLDIAKSNAGRCHVINAEAKADRVFELIRAAVEERFLQN